MLREYPAENMQANIKPISPSRSGIDGAGGGAGKSRRLGVPRCLPIKYEVLRGLNLLDGENRVSQATRNYCTVGCP